MGSKSGVFGNLPLGICIISVFCLKQVAILPFYPKMSVGVFKMEKIGHLIENQVFLKGIMKCKLNNIYQYFSFGKLSPIFEPESFNTFKQP